jgi:streptomycin 6-kinase
MARTLHNGIGIPESLIERVTAWSDQGSLKPGWLDSLPDAVASFETKHQIVWDDRVPRSYLTLVLLGMSPTLGPVVFKSSPETAEFRSESRALDIAGGPRVSRLLDLDLPSQAMIVERIMPGDELHDAGLDDDACTRVHAECTLAFQREVADTSGLIPLRRWMRDLLEWNPDRHPMPEDLVHEAQERGERLLQTADRTVLLHGDLHHHNILRGTNGWHVIDPKGVYGDPGFEYVAWNYNPAGIAKRPDYFDLTRRRIATVSDLCGIPEARLREWAFVGTTLSTLWSSGMGESEWFQDGLTLVRQLRTLTD